MPNTDNDNFDFRDFVKSLLVTFVLLVVIAAASLIFSSGILPCIELFDHLCTKE